MGWQSQENCHKILKTNKMKKYRELKPMKAEEIKLGSFNKTGKMFQLTKSDKKFGNKKIEFGNDKQKRSLFPTRKQIKKMKGGLYKWN